MHTSVFGSKLAKEFLEKTLHKTINIHFLSSQRKILALIKALQILFKLEFSGQVEHDA